MMTCELIEHQIGSWTALTLTDGEISLTVLPNKGADIVSLRQEKTDTEFLWSSPLGLRPLNPSQNFYDNYEGGWQEFFPTAGQELDYRGTTIGRNGEVHALPWLVIKSVSEANEVSLTLQTVAARTPFLLTKKIILRRGTGTIEFIETATNTSEEDLPIVWGQHPALGGNFLSADCKIDAPATTVIAAVAPENKVTSQFLSGQIGVWPHLKNKKGVLVDVSEIASPTARTADQLFIGGFSDGWLAITNRERRVGMAFLFDTKFFQTMSYWQMFGGGVGYPWYGRAYAAALGLLTCVPELNAVDIDHLIAAPRVAAHETLTVRFRVLVYKGSKGVGRISTDGVIVPRI